MAIGGLFSWNEFTGAALVVAREWCANLACLSTGSHDFTSGFQLESTLGTYLLNSLVARINKKTKAGP